MIRGKGQAFWEALVREHEQSGKTQVVFSKERGVSLSALQRWRRKLRDDGADGRGSRDSRFVRVGAEPGLEVAVELGGGVVVKLPLSVGAERIAAITKALLVVGRC